MMRHRPAISLLLLLAYAATRISGLLRFPVFIDEAFHLRWARDLWVLHPFGGFPDGKGLIGAILAPFYPLNAGLWVGRYSVALLGVLAFAMLLYLGRRFLGQRAAWIGGLLVTLTPTLFFFDRLALADSAAAHLMVISAGVSILAIDRRSPGWIMAASILLAVTGLVKLSMLFVFGIPLLIWLALDRTRVGLWRTAAITTGAAILAGAVYGLAIWQIGAVGFGNASRFASVGTAGMPGRIARNAASLFVYNHGYDGMLLLTGFAAAVGFTLARRSPAPILLLALGVGPVIGLWLVSDYFVYRYYVVGLAFVLLLTGALFDEITKQGRAALLRVAGGLLLILMLITPARFLVQYTANPATLTLPGRDQLDYITGNTAGFGLSDAAADLRIASDDTGLRLLCTASITCDRMAAYLLGLPGVTFAPYDVATADWLDSQIGAGARVIVIQDDPPQVRGASAPPAGYHFEALGSYPRPGDGSRFVLLEIAADTEED